MRLICLLMLNLCTTACLFAQDSTIVYHAGIEIAGSNNQTPFLLHANKFGIVPLEPNYASGSWALKKIYNNNNPRLLQWQAGAEFVTNYTLDNNTNVFFTDMYIGGKLGPVELIVGQKKEVIGIIDTLNTSGAMVLSGNSRPYPKIQITIPQFFPLRFTDNFVAFKASYSDGILENSELNYGNSKYMPFTYIHQKSIYLKLGKPYQKLRYYLGMNHMAIWGGESHIWPIYENLSGIKTYSHILSGKHISNTRIGSHSGSIDLGIEYIQDNWKYMIYRQSLFDGGSLFKVTNFSDALNGFSIKRITAKKRDAEYFMIQTFNFEFMSTKNQINQHPDQEQIIYRNANYGNSLFYRNGWSYKGSMLGTPLISLQSKTDPSLPQYPTQITNNNRVVAFSTGITATFMNTLFIFKGNYTMNYGTYFSPFESMRYQISALLGAERKISLLKNTYVNIKVSADQGQLYHNTLGISLGIKTFGFLNW